MGKVRSGVVRAVVAAVVVATMITAPGRAPRAGERVETSRLFVVASPDTEAGPSAVQAFDLTSSGTPEPAERYATLANGRTRTSPQDVEITPDGRFLYVSHNEGGAITGFRVLPDGTLDPTGVFATGGAIVTYLAAHPRVPVLYASTAGAGPGGIAVFEIGAGGALVEIQRVPVEIPIDVEVARDGRALYVASIFPEALTRFEILPSGMLDARLEIAAAGRPWQVEVASDGSRVYLLTLDEGLWTFAATPAGDLVPLDRAPIDGFTETLAVTSDGRFAYVGASFPAGIHGFDLGDDGVPAELAGSPFPARPTGTVLLAPRGASALHQVTRETREIASYAIADDGGIAALGAPAIVPGDDLPNGAAVLRSCRLDVDVDVRPGSPVNPINPGSQGVVPIAILGTAGFDVATIDTGTLRFGPEGAAVVHAGGHLDDVDFDGLVDLLVHFRVRDTGIACGDTRAAVSGETRDGCPIDGSDAIRTLGNCR